MYLKFIETFVSPSVSAQLWDSLLCILVSRVGAKWPRGHQPDAFYLSYLKLLKHLFFPLSLGPTGRAWGPSGRQPDIFSNWFTQCVFQVQFWLVLYLLIICIYLGDGMGGRTALNIFYINLDIHACILDVSFLSVQQYSVTVSICIATLQAGVRMQQPAVVPEPQPLMGASMLWSVPPNTRSIVHTELKVSTVVFFKISLGP